MDKPEPGWIKLEIGAAMKIFGLFGGANEGEGPGSVDEALERLNS